MKKFLVFLCAVLLALGISAVARATLYDMGGGLIYDDDLDITWLQDANYAATELNDARVDAIIAAVNFAPPAWLGTHVMLTDDFDGYGTSNYTGLMTWWGAMAWADQLVYQGYEDWRLPTTVDGQLVYSYDGTTTAGWNITTSEMGYMYYENLGNLGQYAKDTDPEDPQEQPGWGLTNTSFFCDTLQPINHWSGTDYATDPDHAWRFHFGAGYQDTFNKDYAIYAWAVRDGISYPVPEPATMLLLGSGLIGLAAFRRRFRKR